MDLSERIAALETRIASLELAIGIRRNGDIPSPASVQMPGVTYQRLKCAKCGLSFSGATGYVCGASDCPIMPRAR